MYGILNTCAAVLVIIVDSALLETYYHVRVAQQTSWCIWFSSFIMFKKELNHSFIFISLFFGNIKLSSASCVR